MTASKPIDVEKCCCGHPSCEDYWLTGIGKFVQGSGFTKEDAEQIAALLNSTTPDLAVKELVEAVTTLQTLRAYYNRNQTRDAAYAVGRASEMVDRALTALGGDQGSVASASKDTPHG